MEILTERSAGGVLFRRHEAAPSEVCLIRVATRGGNPSWRLPKGWIEPHETPDQAALRETREETGCHGDILSCLTAIEYWYTRRDGPGSGRVRVKKHVEFYLMVYREGDIADHDDEVDEVRWFSIADALKAISYDSEARVLREAIHAWDAYLYRNGWDRPRG